MSSEAITRNDLKAVLDEVLPVKPSEYMKLLWTNSNPTSAFSAQTLSIDLSNYDDIEVEAKTGASIDQYTTHKFVVGDGGLITNFQLNDTWYMRQVTVNSTGIIFGNGRYCYMSNGGNGVLDAVCIPTKIYGIKYERVEPPQLEDLTIIENLGVYNIPATGTWTFPNVKPYKRMFICFPIWGTYNSTTLASTPIVADANQSSTTISNWTNRAGGVVTNTTLSAVVIAIRMEF